MVDLELPDGEGPELLRRIREVHWLQTQIDPYLPVIALRPRARDPWAGQDPDLAADDYLEKPFAYDDLRSRIATILGAFAAGDVTSFPVKQGGLAAQQADTVAEAIAADLGLRPAAAPFEPILRGVRWTGEKPQYLYGMLSGGHRETSVFSERPLGARGQDRRPVPGPFLSAIPGVERPGAQTGARGQGTAADADG